MSPFLLLLIIPGVAWWVLVALFCCGWVRAARKRRRKRLATARAVLTPDCPSLPDVYREFADIVTHTWPGSPAADRLAELYEIPEDKEN